MGGLESSPSCLELTMAIPGGGFITSTPPFASGLEGTGGCNVIIRELDMNQPAAILDEMEELGEDVVDDGGGDGHRPKKLRLSKEQCRLLEESFRHNHTLNPKQKESLAARLQLKPRQVEVWFQNRRARTKLKQTEMECEYLKRCFGSLTEENRRLQQEVEELRALRVAPPTILSPRTRLPVPASALTMCPRCQRVTTSAQPRRPANAASFLSAC